MKKFLLPLIFGVIAGFAVGLIAAIANIIILD